jgi:hypothetical protein
MNEGPLVHTLVATPASHLPLVTYASKAIAPLVCVAVPPLLVSLSRVFELANAVQIFNSNKLLSEVVIEELCVVAIAEDLFLLELL